MVNRFFSVRYCLMMVVVFTIALTMTTEAPAQNFWSDYYRGSSATQFGQPRHSNYQSRRYSSPQRYTRPAPNFNRQFGGFGGNQFGQFRGNQFGNFGGNRGFNNGIGGSVRIGRVWISF